MKSWIKTSILLISLFFVCSFCNARSYPLKEITLSNCKENCTIELPKITNASYYSYKNSALYRKVYSMLRLSTYYWWRDIWAWTHQWVDMACVIWTPVYATHDWIVTVAWTRWNRWNTITIQHERNWKTYYSVYAHLSKIDIQVWDIVKEWEKIWEVWDSWNTTWPHLHFQIDIKEWWNHPYFPSWCGSSIEEKVNAWTCITEVRKNTTDPIVFLEQTTKLSPSTQNDFEDNLYVSSDNIVISGFLWWFIEKNTIDQINISNLSKNCNLLYFPITISSDSEYLTISPSSIQNIVWERSIYFKTKGKRGLSVIEIKYWTKTLKRIPILIWTDDEIKKWKSNSKLMNIISTFI